MNTISEMFQLKGKVAVVSGGAGLIGSKCSEILAEAGADIAIVDANEELGHSEENRISNITGRQVKWWGTDITSEREVLKLRQDVEAKFGRCDILVNAAHYKGGAFFQSLDEYPLEAWRNTLKVNLDGAFLMTREFGGWMHDSDGGAIVNFSSTYGVGSADPRIYGDSGINSPVAYAATKSGLLNFTRYVAVHWSPKVRCNVLVPGGVQAGQDPEFIRNYEYRTPLGRMASPADYQGAILFMCSPASKYMTGATVTVDGGWTAW